LRRRDKGSRVGKQAQGRLRAVAARGRPSFEPRSTHGDKREFGRDKERIRAHKKKDRAEFRQNFQQGV